MSKNGKQVQGTRGMQPPKKGDNLRGKPAITGNQADKNRQVMAIAKHVSKPQDGLALTFEDAMATARKLNADALQAYTAAIAMKDLNEVQLTDLHDYGATLFTAVEEATKLARARALNIVTTKGQFKKNKDGQETLSMEYVLPDGRVKEARIQKHGLQPKTIEAAIRAKQLNPKHYMQEEVTYSIIEDNPNTKTVGTENRLVRDGHFTEDELKAMYVKPQYALLQSRTPKGEE